MKNTIFTKLMLITSSEKALVTAKIEYDNTDDTVQPLSRISLVYNNTEYYGEGIDYLLTDTFADLQSKLPQSVKLACCMTCRYGHMCPYGNEPNKLFCLKGKSTCNKSDVCEIFDQGDISEKCVVSSYTYCESFVYQSDKFYTYNDYLYELQKITSFNCWYLQNTDFFRNTKNLMTTIK